MLTRARTALLLASLVLASPSQAQLASDRDAAAVLSSSAAATADECDFAFGCESLAAAGPIADAAMAATGGDLRALEDGGNPPRPDGAGEPLDAGAMELALLPHLFLDPNEDETFALIAKDLAAAGELVTGSLPSGAPEAVSSPSAVGEAPLSFDTDWSVVAPMDLPADVEQSFGVLSER